MNLYAEQFYIQVMKIFFLGEHDSKCVSSCPSKVRVKIRRAKNARTGKKYELLDLGQPSAMVSVTSVGWMAILARLPNLWIVLLTCYMVLDFRLEATEISK